MTAITPTLLAAETAPINGLRHLLPFVEPHKPLIWIRDEEELAGIGSCLRLEFSGPTRFTDAAAHWRTIAAEARVADQIGVPGTGLVAFGTFAFSDRSREQSVLIIPEIVLGRREGVSWVTRIRAIKSDENGTEQPNAAAVTATPPQPHPLGTKYRTSFAPGAMHSDAYRSAVATTVDLIRQHRLAKAVIARDIVGHLPPQSDLRHAVGTLAARYQDTWTFAVDGLIGSSPETLVSVDRTTVRARVLAGTIARGANDVADHEAAVALASSVKDHDEHEFAVQSVFSALRRHSADLTQSAEPFALKFPNLWHLATDVVGTLSDGSSSLDLISALHPTAAVAGTPTVDALNLIEELEPFDRGRYAGPVGWVDANGNGDWAVALRCAQITSNGDVTAYAGAGIVDGSEPGREFNETRMKFRPIIEAFTEN